MNRLGSKQKITKLKKCRVSRKMGPRWGIKGEKSVKFGLADRYTVCFQKSGFLPLGIAKPFCTHIGRPQRYVHQNLRPQLMTKSDSAGRRTLEINVKDLVGKWLAGQ